MNTVCVGLCDRTCDGVNTVYIGITVIGILAYGGERITE